METAIQNPEFCLGKIPPKGLFGRFKAKRTACLSAEMLNKHLIIGSETKDNSGSIALVMGLIDHYLQLGGRIVIVDRRSNPQDSSTTLLEQINTLYPGFSRIPEVLFMGEFLSLLNHKKTFEGDARLIYIAEKAATAKDLSGDLWITAALRDNANFMVGNISRRDADGQRTPPTPEEIKPMLFVVLGTEFYATSGTDLPPMMRAVSRSIIYFVEHDAQIPTHTFTHVDHLIYMRSQSDPGYFRGKLFKRTDLEVPHIVPECIEFDFVPAEKE